MNRRVQIGVAALALSGGLWAQQGENPFKPFDQAAFEAHMQDAGATEELLETFRRGLRLELPSHVRIVTNSI